LVAAAGGPAHAWGESGAGTIAALVNAEARRMGDSSTPFLPPTHERQCMAVGQT